MAILKIKNENGEWISVPAIVGPAGEPGPQGPAGNDYVLTEADKQEIAGMIEVSGGGEESFFKLSSATTVLDDNQFEEILYLINERKVQRPFLIDNQYICVSYYVTGYGGQYSIDCFTARHRSGYQNSNDYLYCPAKYRLAVNTSTKEISFYLHEAYIPEDLLSLNSSTTPGKKTRIKDALTYLNGQITTIQNAGYQTADDVNALIASALGEIGVAEEGAY